MAVVIMMVTTVMVMVMVIMAVVDEDGESSLSVYIPDTVYQCGMVNTVSTW